MHGSPRIITSARHTGNRSSGIIAGPKRAQPRGGAEAERGKNAMEKTRGVREGGERKGRWKKGKREGRLVKDDRGWRGSGEESRKIIIFRAFESPNN